MSTNWSLYEGAKVILAKEDMETVAKLVSKFPITSLAIQAVGADREDDLLFLLHALPIHTTMRKAEAAFKSLINGETTDEESDDEDVEETEDVEEDTDDEDVTDEDDEEEEPAPTKKKGPGRPRVNKTKDEKNAEHRKREKIRKSEKEAEDEADEFDVDEETGEVDYSAMTAVELYKLCKKRGITARAKRSSKEYIELLKKADEEAMAVSDDDDEEDDDWDDDDAPMNAPEDDSDEDEDDDWDI